MCEKEGKTDEVKTVIGGVPLGEMMAAVHNAFLWLLVYVLVVKFCMCCGKCESGTDGGGMSGGGM